jgi:P27 family predicted phage terminase small subunit
MNPAKPTALKILEGNPGKRPLNKNEPKPQQGKYICPSWLDDEAKKEWNRIVPELKKLGLLTVVDYPALIGYCQSWARYIEAEKHITKVGTSFETINSCLMPVPEVAIAQKYLKLCQSFMIQFGLTPSSRGRITLPGESIDDEFERLLDG